MTSASFSHPNRSERATWRLQADGIINSVLGCCLEHDVCARLLVCERRGRRHMYTPLSSFDSLYHSSQSAMPTIRGSRCLTSWTRRLCAGDDGSFRSNDRTHTAKSGASKSAPMPELLFLLCNTVLPLDLPSDAMADELPALNVVILTELGS